MVSDVRFFRLSSMQKTTKCVHVVLNAYVEKCYVKSFALLTRKLNLQQLKVTGSIPVLCMENIVALLQITSTRKFVDIVTKIDKHYLETMVK